MIDKYKRPRVQRMVPERTAAGVEVMTRHAMRVITKPARHFMHTVAEVMASTVLRSIATEDAKVSGALPGEFDPKELRFPAQ